MTKTDVLNALWAMALEAWPVGEDASYECRHAYFSLLTLYCAVEQAVT